MSSSWGDWTAERWDGGDGQGAKPGEEESEAPTAPWDPQNPEAPPGVEGSQVNAEPSVPEGLQGPEDIWGKRQGRDEEVHGRGRGAQAGRPGAATWPQ